jgi:hypothetical protein
MTIPIEFIATGKPSSVNGDASKKKTWKTAVRDAAEAELIRVHGSPSKVPVPNDGQTTVKVFFFRKNAQYADTDNGLKHTLDSLTARNLRDELARLGLPTSSIQKTVLEDDKKVTRIIAERFVPQPGSSLVAPAGMAPLLRKALAIAGGFPNLITAPATVKEHATAIKVEKYLDNQGGFW